MLRSKTLRLILLAIGLVIIIIIVALILTQKASSQSMGAQFTNDVLKGNANGAYTLTDPMFRQVTSMAQFQSDVKYIDSTCAGPAILSLNKTTGITANLIFIASSGQSNCHINIDLQKSNGQWQIDFMNEY